MMEYLNIYVFAIGRITRTLRMISHTPIAPEKHTDFIKFVFSCIMLSTETA